MKTFMQLKVTLHELSTVKLIERLKSENGHGTDVGIITDKLL